MRLGDLCSTDGGQDSLAVRMFVSACSRLKDNYVDRSSPAVVY